METSQLFRTVSNKWQRRLGLMQCPARGDFSTGPNDLAIQKDISVEIKEILRRVYGDGETWTCEEQKRGVEDILKGISPLVGILPTGGGKTALILIPALVNEAKTMIVMTPYISLANDLEKRCWNSHISCLRWTPGTKQRATIVVVVSDTGTSAEFQM